MIFDGNIFTDAIYFYATPFGGGEIRPIVADLPSPRR